MTRVALLLFDQFDLLDVGGPYEVLLTANRLAQRDGGDAPFEVRLAGATTDPLTACGALRPTSR